MNRDTPGAVPSDDFPFLGPAISPRRQDAGEPAASSSGELAGPFVGGMFRSAPEEEASAAAAESDVPPIAAGFDEDVSAEEAGDPLEDLPTADWPADDFPWLTPAEPETAAAPMEEPWRATADVEDLAPPEAYAVEEDTAVDHFSWIGAPQPEVSEQPREEGVAGAEAAQDASAEEAVEESTISEPDAEAGHFGWEGGPVLESEAPDVSAFEPGSADEESTGFSVDSEPAEESWSSAPGWGVGAGAEISDEASAGDGDTTEEGESDVSGTSFAWGEAAGQGESAEVNRWDADEAFRVEDEEAGAVLEEEAPVGAAAAEPAEPAVDAAPLPVGQWEEAAPEIDVEDEAQAPDAGAVEVDGALEEVAERLERIARSLRSGKPVEAFEEGDPLQLLITGYALGYSQARRGRREG